MVVLGNPPYSGESANKGEWISNLMDDYKIEPGGSMKLKEKNSKAINADEYKFIRYGQHYIEKNGSGILAFINPHTFLDASICRGMRWSLLKTFDKICTIDLHGNSTKKETALDGSADVNVFDIMQGVSINIFVKTDKKKTNELGKVFHFDLFGKRELKYDFLFENSVKSVGYKEIKVNAPNYYFVPKDFIEEQGYSKGFELTELIPFKTSGIKTHDDTNLVSDSLERLEKNLINLNQQFDNSKVRIYTYRPFDNGYIYYDTKLLGRAREKTIYH
jgi:predicted helicase